MEDETVTTGYEIEVSMDLRERQRTLWDSWDPSDKNQNKRKRDSSAFKSPKICCEKFSEKLGSKPQSPGPCPLDRSDQESSGFSTRTESV